MRPWFAGKLDFSPAVANLEPEGFPLLGARVDYVANRYLAALEYGRRNHKITVFVAPSEGERFDAPRRTSRNGYNVIEWTSGDLNYRAVSDLGDQELQEFAALDAAEHGKVTAPQIVGGNKARSYRVSFRIRASKPRITPTDKETIMKEWLKPAITSPRLAWKLPATSRPSSTALNSKRRSVEFSSRWRSSRKRGPPFLFYQLARPDCLPPALATPNLLTEPRATSTTRRSPNLNDQELQEFATRMQANTAT